MGLFDMFKKNKPSPVSQENKSFMSDLKYNDINIEITYNVEESKNHISEDFETLEKEGIENIIKKQFIPWLKGEDFKDRDDDKVFEGLRVYYIGYSYHRIIDKYSPTGEENFFGEFEFDFESANEYTSDMLEGVTMQVYVLNGKVVKVKGFDI